MNTRERGSDMKSIILWGLAGAAVFFGTLTGLYWVLREYFRISNEGILMLLVPTFLVGGLSAVYGFCYWIINESSIASGAAGWSRFVSAFRINLFGLLLIIPVFLSLYFLIKYQDTTLSILFGMIAAGVSIWVIPKLTKIGMTEKDEGG